MARPQGHGPHGRQTPLDDIPIAETGVFVPRPAPALAVRPRTSSPETAGPTPRRRRVGETRQAAGLRGPPAPPTLPVLRGVRPRPTRTAARPGAPGPALGQTPVPHGVFLAVVARRPEGVVPPITVHAAGTRPLLVVLLAVHAVAPLAQTGTRARRPRPGLARRPVFLEGVRRPLPPPTGPPTNVARDTAVLLKPSVLRGPASAFGTRRGTPTFLPPATVYDSL